MVEVEAAGFGPDGGLIGNIIQWIVLKVGIRPPTFVLPHATPGGAQVFEYARRVEALGFDSMFLIDHLLTAAPTYPVSWSDCLSTLGALAACTGRVRIGTLVLVLPLYHPVQLAKALATIDQLSAGRLIAGFGGGWSRAEFGALGIPHQTRGHRMTECLRILMDLWTKDEVTFEGRFYRFGPLSLEPKPVQRPHPPIWIGGGQQPFERIYGMQVKDVTPALRRIARYADGWSYHVSSTPDMIAEDWRRISEFAKQFGREPGDIEIVYSNFVHLTDTPQDRETGERVLRSFTTLPVREAERTYLLGTAVEILDRVKQAEAATVRIDHVILNPLTWDLGQLERVSNEVVPELRRW